MNKRLKYRALIEAAKYHRDQAQEHRIFAKALEDEAKDLKHRSIIGRLWRKND